MKKPLLISLTALAVFGITTATTLYAQTTTGSSVIARMKAAAANFTLTELIPTGQTGLTSAPLVGKKTGDILTAGEYNRLLEIVAQGGTGGSGWVNVPLTDTSNFDIECEYRISFPAYSTKPAVKQYAWAVYAGKIEFGDTGTNDYPVYIPNNDKANYYHPQYGKVTSWGVAPNKIEKRCN